MLFDLQSPRRRRVVRVVFGGLAAIFAISFIGFGVGTGSGGGGFLSNLFGGGGGGSAASAFDGQISAAQKAVVAGNTAAYAQLVQLHYSAALQNVDSKGQLNSGGEQHLREGADAWNKYVKTTKDVTPTAALYALQTFDQLGSIDFAKARTDTSTTEALSDVNAAVSDWKTAGQAQQILIQKEPKKAAANSYARLASYLYLSGQTQAGNQAAAQAKQKGGSAAASLDQQLKPIQQLGQQLQTAIAQLTKQQQKTQGATAGGNPLGGLSGSGGLSGGGGLGGGTGGFGGP